MPEPDFLMAGSLNEHIADELHRDSNELLTRWVVIAEFVGDDGEKRVYREYEPSMAPWDVDALVMFDDYEG